MRNRVKPIIVASKCLGFAACRYNGISLPDPVVEALKKYVTFQTVCPEVEIGLGVPRDPIRIVTEKGELFLFQPSTGKDVTKKMTAFTSAFLDSVKDVDGFILKHRSPSCGLKDVKVYPKQEKSGSISKTSGFFSAEVLKRFALYPIEDEGRLKNFGIREHFLTQLFAFASLRTLKKKPTMRGIVNFHTENKYILMTYSEKEMRILGKVVANHEQRKIEDLIDIYQSHFYAALSKPPTIKRSINSLMHTFGYFSKKITAKERKYFLDTLERYREKKIPLSVPVAIIRSYIARFNEEYLEKQTFFDPYPEELVEVTDSGKGRDIGK